MSDLFLPPGPVVPVRSGPDSRAVANALLLEDPDHVGGARQNVVRGACDHADVHRREPGDPFDVHVRDVRGRTVEVAEIVPVAVEKVVDVVLAGKSHDLVADIRMAKAEVDGVVRAERGSESRDLRTTSGLALHPGDDLFEDIAVVLVVPGNARGGRTARRIKALRVHTVDTDDLQVPRLDVVGYGADEAEVFVLVEAALRGREPDHRTAASSEPQKLHLAAKDGRLPEDVFAVHARSLSAGAEPHDLTD